MRSRIYHIKLAISECDSRPHREGDGKSYERDSISNCRDLLLLPIINKIFSIAVVKFF